MGGKRPVGRLVFAFALKYNNRVECINCRAEIPAGRDHCPRCGHPVPAEQVRFAELNRIFAGRYDFLRLLGTGGFAEVFLARDMLLDREVAVKILLSQHAQDPQTVERFLREAKLYAKLEHPNIIPIYDTGVLQRHVFITMKFIRGESLKHTLFRQKRIPPQLLPGIVRGVAQALAYIHRQGIVHRDIKPANIIVEKETQSVYLADFGIARAESSQTLTQTGMIVGTPHYLAPEQIQGKKTDPRSDIYSLGATLYELTSGRPPFQGDSPLEILYQHLNESAEPLSRLVPGIDPVLARIISRCIQKDPQRRFQNAEEILAMLEPAGRGEAAAQEKTVLTAARAALPKKTRMVWIGLALVVVLAAAAYYFWPRGGRPPSQAGSRAGAAMERPASREETRPVPVPAQQPPVAAGAGEAEAKPGGAEKTAAKHEPAAPPLTREEGRRAEKAGEAGPAAGAVRFSSFPPLADVSLRGDKIGNTEQVFEKKFPPGDYLFTFAIPGFQSVEVKVTVVAGETVKAHYRFPLFRSFTITAKPFGRILIDGHEYGDTPQTVKLAYGEHRIRITKDGYRSEERNVRIDQDAKNSIYFELVKEEIK
jgi:tRNA A-37 threonylcarbamoyl transferase component Bud32